MNTDLTGSFVFRNEGDGCLTSKYFNHGTKKQYVECCLKRNGQPGGLVGEYDSMWREAAGNVVDIILTIAPAPNDTFYLEWKDLNGVLWKGVAMRTGGDSLVGTYWR
jgi:hypothetical protein